MAAPENLNKGLAAMNRLMKARSFFRDPMRVLSIDLKRVISLHFARQNWNSVC